MINLGLVFIFGSLLVRFVVGVAGDYWWVRGLFCFEEVFWWGFGWGVGWTLWGLRFA